MKKFYKMPELKTYGNARELTKAPPSNNKIGSANDALTGLTGIQGDLISCGPCANV